jgi:hypothetical protein
MATRSSDSDRPEDDASERDEGLDAQLDRAVSASEPEAFLVGVGGAHGGRVYPLIHNTIFVGRSDGADVLVADPSVSQEHARIINGAHGFEIHDLNSTNGTFVEGQRITRTRLRSGDRITIGQVDFKFLVDRRVNATMTIIPAGLPVGARRETALTRDLAPIVRPTVPRTNFAFVPPPQRDADEGPSLEEIVGKLALAYRFIERNFRLIAFFAALGGVVGLLSVLALPPPGEAVCVLKLQPQIKANPVDGQWNRPPSEDQEVRFFAGAEAAFIQPGLVADTLKKLTGRDPTDSLVNSYTERLRLEPELDHTYLARFREKLIDNGRVSATQFLSAHLENYLHREIDHAIRVFSAQADFLRDQLKSVEGEMTKISNEKMQFSQKNSDRLPEEASQVLGSRFGLESRRAELVAEVRKLQSELEAQRKALASEGPLASNKLHESEVYRKSLAEVNRKLTEAYSRGLADGHPEVIALNGEKQRLNDLIEKEMGSETSAVDRRSNAGYQEIQGRVASLEGQLSAARSDLGDIDKNLGHVQSVVGDLPRVQAGVQRLTHIQDATTQLHGQLFEQLKKAELQLNLERVSAESRYEVVVPPRLNKEGRLRAGVMRAGAGFFLGLFLALATIVIRRAREMVSQALSNLESRSATSRR